jgi:hypothetical protein
MLSGAASVRFVVVILVPKAIETLKRIERQGEYMFMPCTKNSGTPHFTFYGIPLYKKKSDRRDSNPRFPPWQGGALPTEPLSHKIIHCLLNAFISEDFLRTKCILLQDFPVVNKFFYL